MAENSVPKQRGRPFQKGCSGNPAGKPKGARHKATLAAEALLDGEAEKLTRKAIERALEGDGIALRLCLERILPARKERPITIDLPPTSDAAGVAVAQEAVVQAVSEGRLALDEATALSGLLEARRRALETEDLEARIERLEQQRK